MNIDEKKQRKSFYFLGAFMVLGGIAALVAPLISGEFFTLFIGVMLIINGLAQGYYCIKMKSWRERKWYLLAAVLYLIVGIYIQAQPIQSMLIITNIILFCIILNGVFRAMYGFRNRKLDGSGYIIISGVLTAIIGIYLYFFISLSLTFLGVFIGVTLLMEGLSLISLGTKLKAIKETN